MSLLVLALLAVSGLSNPTVAATTEGPFAEKDWDGVVLRLELDKPEYYFAEPVHIKYIVTNNRPTVFHLDFTSSAQFYFHVYGPQGAVYKPNLYHFWWMTVLHVEPGETYVYSATWDQKSCVGSCAGRGSVWPGHYTLFGFIYSYEETTALGVDFDVVNGPRKEIGGPLPYDVTLTKDGSPYHVFSDLIVPRGVTVTIEPGVELQFDYAQGPQGRPYADRGAGVTVYGTLIARGTPEENIVFRSSRTPYPTSSDWKGISFLDTSEDVSFDPDTGEYAGGCILEHCLLEQAVTPLDMKRASPLVSNCIIRNNGEPKEPPLLEVPPPPLIHGTESRALIVNCTIVRNFKFIQGDFTFVNSIIWHNINLGLEGFAARHCNIEGGYPGEGNISADPLFLDLAHADYHLHPDSPCIDVGTTDVQGLSHEDMDGDPRVSGEKVDIGADECVPKYSVTAFEPGELCTMLYWNSFSGKRYCVHASDDMQNWVCVSPVLTAGGNTAMFVDNYDKPLRQRYYRVEVLP